MAMAKQDQDDTGTLNSETLIAGSYSVDFFSPAPGIGAGLQAFPVKALSGDARRLMALQVPAHLPPLLVPSSLPTVQIPHLLTPVAYGAVRAPDRRMAQMVVGYAPAGSPLSETALPSLGEIGPWSEDDLLRHVLAPSAEALEQLHSQGGTHRAIRINNIFRVGNAGPVTLGAYWAAAPASLQAAVYEAPATPMCHPAARGAGTAADDVYALGVSLLILAAGRTPMPGLSNAGIIARKLELGSFAALTADIRLTPALANILRGMLADDPDQRPGVASLIDPSAAKARKVAPRPYPRAKKPLVIARISAWNPQAAAFAFFQEPKAALEPLRTGIVDRWLRQMFGDHVIAARTEELVRRNAEGSHAGGDPEFIMRAICLLDPLAPLCWHGLALWPDGLGALLSPRTDSEVATRLDEVIDKEMIAAWAAGRPERCNAIALKLDARRLRTLFRMPGWSGGRARLRYVLGPMNPLASPLLDGHAVTELPGLLPALEAREDTNPGPALSIDREICAFIAAREQKQATRAW